MAVVEPGYGTWLKADARYVTAALSGSAAAYGDVAVTSSLISPIALKADAETEAVAQAQFLAGPLARDRHIVQGMRRDLVGKPITLRGDRSGYSNAGNVVFVVGASERADSRSTVLTVLKRL